MIAKLFAMLVFGVPVAVTLAGASAAFILANGTPPTMVVAHHLINEVENFPLWAVPFFNPAGKLMNTAGITERIFNFALSMVGWMRGGIGHVNVGGRVIFVGMCRVQRLLMRGHGAIEIKAMRDAGYDLKFAAGFTAASSTIGPIIPLSLSLMIYGIVAGTSIGQLFVAEPSPEC